MDGPPACQIPPPSARHPHLQRSQASRICCPRHGQPWSLQPLVPCLPVCPVCEIWPKSPEETLAIISASGIPPSFCGRASPSVRLCRRLRTIRKGKRRPVLHFASALPVRCPSEAAMPAEPEPEPALGPGVPSLLIGRWCDRWATRASGDFLRVACCAESNSCHDGRHCLSTCLVAGYHAACPAEDTRQQSLVSAY